MRKAVTVPQFIDKSLNSHRPSPPYNQCDSMTPFGEEVADPTATLNP